MNITESTTSSVHSLQGILSALTVLGLTNYHCPTPVTVPDGATFDFVVVGSGPGGSTLANRLTEDGNTTVLLLEAGEIFPLESSYMGLFSTMTKSKYDWNLTSTDDSYSNQNLQGNHVEMTMGKMLGGSSSLHHVLEVTGNYRDYERWAKAADDDSYKLEYMREYLKKRESLKDAEILAAYPSYHGTSGPIEMKRQPSEKNKIILDAVKELGHKVILDINANETLGYTEPLLSIGDVWRQSAAESYLGQAKNRPNLYVQIKALVTKVHINDKKVATGVEVLTDGNVYKTYNARKEVILCAGALKTPQILMLSGVGPTKHLKKFDIDVKANLPVGENLIDHVSVTMGYPLEKSNATVASNPTEFPAPVTTGYVSLGGSNVPDYQSLNLVFSQNNSGLTQICSWVFKYKENICNAFYEVNSKKEVLFDVVNLMLPKSRGTVRLASTDPTANPIVKLDYLSHSSDLKKLALSIQDFDNISKTKYFKSIGSSMIDFNLTKCHGLEKGSYDFYKCYAKEMSTTMWHYSSTCAIGKVLDKHMIVKGFENLRVVDASAIPNTISGNIAASIYALAEKAADIIKNKWNLC